MPLHRTLIRNPLSIAIITMMGVASSLCAENAMAKAQSYYEKDESGWFWYLEPPVQEDKAEEEKQKEPKKEEPKVKVMEAPPAEPAEPAKPAEAEDKGPPTLSAAWFRQNLQVYMDKAIDNPTKENVEAYFLLQRVMMDKAQDFSEMSRRVVIGDKLLDEGTRRALDPATSRLQETLSADNRKKMLDKVLSQAGLAFFFSAECALCDSQGNYLNYLAQRTGIEIMPISIDGKPLPSGVFKDTMLTDSGQAENLGIEEGPALFLLAPPDRWIPLSYSVITQEEAITRVLTAAAEEGLISEEEFNETRPINVTPSLAKNIPEDGDLPEDTQELIELLRGLEQQ